MERKFKHKSTGIEGLLKDGHLYFQRCIEDMCSNETLHESFVLGSCDWEEITKSPLFTTEDNVDIFEGDEFYWLDKGLNINNSGYSTDKGFPHITLYFSTKEKAEEYVIMNKPCLSLNDYYSLFDKKFNGYDIGQELKQLVKRKLKDGN